MKELTVDNALQTLRLQVHADLRGWSFSLCAEVLENPSFAESPASTGHHHAFRGGLALHTAEVVRGCALMGNDLDWECLLTAAIWHDYQKIREYDVEDSGDVYKVRGSAYRDLIGHVCGSVLELHRTAVRMNLDIPADKLDKVTHCMLAHHGRLEWRSPIEPRMPEAWVLHAADMMSARQAG